MFFTELLCSGLARQICALVLTLIGPVPFLQASLTLGFGAVLPGSRLHTYLNLHTPGLKAHKSMSRLRSVMRTLRYRPTLCTDPDPKIIVASL